MAELTDVVLGGSKKFECRVLGYPRPEIRWYKDGIEITHVKRYNFNFTQDGVISMVMENISHKDQGMYRCRADNSEGTASTSAYLFVRKSRGHPDEDTMSIHSMTMSEVDTEYQERQLEFESYAKRIQIDFNGEEFMDEFGRKQKFEDILAEEKKSIKKLEDEEIEKGMREKSEKSVANSYTEESYSSKQESYYEESYEKSSSKTSKGYSESQETKMSATVSTDGVHSESQMEQTSRLSVETSISESSASQKDSSQISIESEISSSQYSAEETSKMQIESVETSTSKTSSVKDEEASNFKKESQSESGMSLEVESLISSSKTHQEQELIISSSVEIEETSGSISKSTSEEQLVLESDVSIDNSTSSRTTIEEREVKLTGSDAEIDSSRSRESTLEIDDSCEVFTTEGDGSILVDSSVEIEHSKVKRKKRMSVEMEVEERSTVEIDLESKILKSKMLEEIRTMTAEMQTMSKDNIPTDMGSVSSINSLFSEEGSIEESSTSMNPSEILEAKIRSKMQARVLETESNADAESVRDFELSEGAAEEQMIDDEIQAAVRAEHETLAQESNLQSDRVLDLPMGEKEQMSTSHGHDSGIFEMSTTETSSSRVEETSTKTTTESTSTLETSSTEEAKIRSAEDDKEKATIEAVSSHKQDLAKADEMNFGRDDTSIASELTDLDSVRADELSLDGRSELGEASIKGEETWHTDQLSDTESMRDETSDFKAEDIRTVEADITEEQQEQKVKAEQQTEDSVETVDALDGPSDSRDVTPTPESFGAEDDFRIQSPINEETVSEISEGSIREADFAMDESLPDGGQFVTSPSDLTSLVRDSQKQSRVTAQTSEDVEDIIDDALKDLEMDTNTEETNITKEPSPDQADVRVAEEILEAPEEKVRQKYKPEEQELTFIPDEVPEKKTKSKKSKRSTSEEEELTMTASVETSETSIMTQESTTTIQADVDVSGVTYDDGGLTISASIEVEETHYPPEVVRVTEDVNIQAGETIHLESEVKGNPQPEVKWFKEGEKVAENQRITIVTEDNVYSLEIREAEGSDGGKYTLTAHNSEGTIFSDVQVNVTIPQGQEDKIIMEGQNISVTASLSLPEFTRSPEDTTVSEFDPVSFVCEVSGNPEPKVTWRKEGQKLKSDQRMRIYESDGQHFLEIPQSSLLDAGEYECEATNSEGSTSCHIMLTVEAATEQESGLSAAEEAAQHPGASESDELFLQEFIATTSYIDKDTKVTLNVGEVVQVLDSKLTTGSWLVRKQTDKEQVCYVPTSVLQRADETVKDLGDTLSRKKELRLTRSPSLRLDHELETSEDEAGLFHLKETFQVYMVVADYNQSSTDPDELRLVEGQYVEVIDKQRPDSWLVRTKPTKTTPSKQGWVPSAYFDVKTSMGSAVKKDTREQFRDEILHIKNKQQEAGLKRSTDENFRSKLYLLTELVETEREYIKDLQHLVEVYYGKFQERDAPDVLQNKHDEIFSNIKAILKFHHDSFLNSLTTSTAFPGKIGGVFLKNKDYFMMYIEYLYSREAAGFFLDTEEAKKYYKKYSRSVGESENNFPQLLNKGEQRLATYLSALKEFLRYSQRAGDEEGVKEMENAISMINEVYKGVEQRKLLETVEGFTGDLQDCGQLLRHDDVLMWDAETQISRCKERHMLLFPEKVLLTKRKRPDSPTETTTYAFKSAIQLVDVQINEVVEEDERRFELWTSEPSSEVYTFQARSIYAKQSWVRDIRESLVKLGVQVTDVMEERKIKKPLTPPSPSTPRKKTSEGSSTAGLKPEDIQQALEEQSGSESDRTIKTDDYKSLSSHEDSDYNTDISSYHTAPEFEDGTSRPMFKRRPKKTVASEGTDVKLECIVGGLPIPSVVWQKNNQPIKETETCKVVTDGETSILHLDNVDLSVAGQYSVKATNKNASIVCSADVIILEDVREQGEFDREKTPTPQATEEDLSIKEATPVPEEESKPKNEPKEEPQPEPKEEPKPEPKEVPKPEPKEESKPEPKEELKPELEEEPKPKEEPKPESKEKPKPEPKPEPKEEPKPEPKEKPKPEPKEEPKPEPKEEPKPEPKEKPKPEPKEEPKEEPKPEPKEEPKPEPKEEPKPEPKEELKPELKEEPKPEPKEELKPEPKEELKPEPKEVPKPEPKEKPKPEPKEELKPEPKEEPKPEPKEEPKPEQVEEESKYKETEPVPTTELSVEATDLPVVEGEDLSYIPEEQPKTQAPIIVDKMKDCDIEEGRLARFDCRVCAFPVPDITWEKDGKVVEEDSHFKLLHEKDEIFSLLIKDCTLSDSGKYRCWARNEYGEAYTESLLNVIALDNLLEEGEVKPAFSTRFYDVEVTEGVPAEFVCMIKGDPSPDVKWYLNGELLKPGEDILMRKEDDGHQLLAFRNVRLDQAGEVTCKLKNDLGEATCIAQLIVKEDPRRHGPEVKPPKFIKKPVDTEVDMGGDVKLECTVAGEPEPDVTWFFEDRELFESHRRIIRKSGNNHVLKLRNMAAMNAGEYTIRAVNMAGEASCTFKLGVNELEEIPDRPSPKRVVVPETKYGSAPSFASRISDARSLKGGKARFGCRTMGIPQPEIQWCKDGRPLTSNDHVQIGRDSTGFYLTVSDVAPEDEGEYSCTIKNDSGKASCSARLQIGDPQPTQTYQYMPKDRKKFSPSFATVDTAPPVRRTFVELAPDEKVPTMPIGKPSLLEVKADGAKLSWLPAYTSGLPENAGPCSYTVEAREVPGTYWSKLGTDVYGTTYLARQLRPDKEYQFRVRAENRFGSSEPSPVATLAKREAEKPLHRYTETPEIKEMLARLRDAPPVLPTTSPMITDMGAENVRLAWKPVELPTKTYYQPDVTYSIEAQRLPNEEWVPLASRVPDTSYYLSDLGTDRDYNIRVRAENQYGRSAPTQSLWLPRATAFSGVPVSRPQIVEMEPDSVRLSWARVNVPAFDHEDEPLLYMIEMQEPPSLDWQTIARQIPDTYHRVSGLSPGHDYRFRVRPVTAGGRTLEPSPAASLFRTLAQSHVPIDKVRIDDYEPDYESVRLSWRRVEIPPFDMGDEPLLYMIERSEPNIDNWRPVVSGLPVTSYRIPDIGAADDYRFRVRAITPYGLSPPSHPAGLYRSPSAMRSLPSESLRVLDMQPEKLRLAWQPSEYKSTEPIRYQIESQELPSLEWRPMAKDVTDTSYMVHGLRPTMDYRLRVRPQTSSGYLEPTEPISITSMPVRPRLPIREPSIADIGPTSVELAWKPAEIPMYSRQIIPVTYSIDMQEYPGTNWTPVARRIPESHYMVTGLRPDVDYDFRVRPETEYGPGEVSLPVKLRRRPVLHLPQREPMLCNITPDSCELTWSHVKPVHSGKQVTYKVEIKEPPSTSWKHLIGNIPGTNLPIRFLKPDQDYLFRVIAESGEVVSEPSLAAYLPHRGGPPRMPTEMPYISEVYPDSLMLSWRSVELPSRITDYSPVRYNIEVKESPLFDWRPLVYGVPRTQYRVTGLKPDRDYVFRVRAESNFGLSEPTEPITVYRRPVMPALPTEEPIISDVRPSSVRLSWRPADIPSYMHDTTIPVTYTILCQEYPDTNWRPLVRRIPYTDYTVMGLQPNRDYAFRVQAENDFGTSKPTFPATLHRRPEYHLPIEFPEIEEYKPSYLQLKWRRPSLPATMPATKPITYSLETYQPVDRKWIPYASKIPDTSYRISELTPSKDYMFRIRPEIGSQLLEPSLPISYSRKRVLPSVPVERPEIFELEPESVSVSWRPVRLPSYGVEDIPRRFRLEMRELTNPHWTTVAPHITGLNYRVRDLNPDTDYAFRVRAVLDEGGVSEPSPAIFLHRRPVISRPPVQQPGIRSVDDTSVLLGWQRVDIPAFEYDQEPMTFIIEGQRLPDYNWRPLARGLKDTSYRVKELDSQGDYNFRIRGESSLGLTEPSPIIPFYRRPIRSGVPIARPTILDEDATTARLRWSPAYIPSSHHAIPKSYIIEKQESPSPIWRPLAKGVTSTDYTITDLSPRKDYHFRIRGVTPHGQLTEPTPPIPYYRTQLLKYEPLPIYKMKLMTEDYSVPNRPYIEQLTTKVPPRLSIEKPELYELSPESIQLSWNQARVPATTAMLSPTTYRIEVRQPNSFDWREVTGGLVGLSHTVKNLNPLWDYAFRVRAVNDYGLSEPTLPVFLNRHSDLSPHIEDYDYDSQFGQSVPPKLPIDSPAMLDMAPESLTLKWFPARIPAYAKKAPITYQIEMREPVGPGWRKMVAGLKEPVYHVTGLTPKQDYTFRIRAESPFGISEPTLPVSYTRSKAPVIKRSYDSDRDRELISPARFMDSITAGVPPRVPAGRPNMTKQSEDRLLLSWQTARMPSYLKNTPITYIVEMREPPSHAWNTLTTDLPETHFEVSKLRPDQDYMFRVRAKNEFGMSEPTLPATLFREREERKPLSRSRSRESFSPFTKVRIGTPTSRERSMTMERVVDYIPSPPEFLTPPDEDQYAVESVGCKIYADIKGYPVPNVTWYFKGQKLDTDGGRYNLVISPVGQIDLDFGNVTWDDIGDYTCVAENEHGKAERIIPLKMADPPTFIEPLKDLILVNRGTGKLECRVDGIPYPTIKFNKDWRPLTETSRVRIRHESPDYFSLTIDGALSMDAGQYTCVAENPAGKIFCSARIEVEDNLPAPCDLEFKNANIEDGYYVLEELGRGRHGIVRRVIEKSTGKQYAGKFISVREDGEKDFFRNELETLRLLNHKNIVGVQDAYETPKSLILVTELLNGGGLVDRIIDQNNWTDNDVAAFVKQLLETVKHLHDRNILHLDIKPSNILYPEKDSDDFKLIDFGFARKCLGELRMNYGTPDFSSPEAVNNEPVGAASDLWSVGSMAYTLLCGSTPFQADSDPEILEKVMESNFQFPQIFDKLSPDSKDFISKLLVLEPSKRLTMEESLNHPWIKNAGKDGKGNKLDNSSFKQLQNRISEQEKHAAVKTVANLRSLRRLMDGDLSDLGFQPMVDPITGQVTFPDSEAYGEFADEETWYDWQARQHQEGQLRTPADTDYNIRVRGYQRASSQLSDSMKLDEAVSAILDGSKVSTTKERRMLSVDREELHPSIEREMEWLDGVRKHRTHEYVESSCPSKRSSISSVTGDPELPPPLFKTKIQNKAYLVGEDILFKCQVVGPPPPTVTWYRNEELLTDGARIQTSLAEDGTATLLILHAKPYDGGVYKCVARNKYGRTSCRARLQPGDVPNRPGRPVVTQVTSNSALLIWEAPKSDGNSDILYYKVDCKKLGDERWTTVVKILHECAVVEGLKPDEAYRFRVSAVNQFGMSPYSWSSVQVTTKPSGGKIYLDEEQELAILKSHKAEEQPTPVTSRRETREDGEVDDSEDEPTLHKASPDSDYQFTDSLWKGKFSELKLCNKVGSKAERVMKVLPVSDKSEPEKIAEYANLRDIRHTKIIRLYDVYFTSGNLYLIFERLYGDHIVRQLAFKRRYSEDNVASVIRQVLGGLQFLHRIGIAHLNLQPSSIVAVSRRHLDVKIVDFGLSQKIPNQDGIVAPRVGYPDFIPPEVVAQERVTEAADIWGVAALTFLMLSGDSPYAGETDEHTLLNIVYNRYDPHDLYDNISKEALKFIFKIMKRLPKNRLSVQDCLEHKWLLQTDSVVKTRKDCVFLTNKLRKFCKDYDWNRKDTSYRRDFTTFTLPEKKPVKRVKPKSKAEVTSDEQASSEPEPVSDELHSEAEVTKVEPESVEKVVDEIEEKPVSEETS